jgi:predicted ABC-type ATPase
MLARSRLEIWCINGGGEVSGLSEKYFAFETTLSGLGYVRRMRAWKRAGYRIEIVYLRLQSSRLALKRIAARVREGGHDVPRPDVVRRFGRGWDNFRHVYCLLADVWTVYDNSGREPRLLERSE